MKRTFIEPDKFDPDTFHELWIKLGDQCFQLVKDTIGDLVKFAEIDHEKYDKLAFQLKEDTEKFVYEQMYEAIRYNKCIDTEQAMYEFSKKCVTRKMLMYLTQLSIIDPAKFNSKLAQLANQTVSALTHDEIKEILYVPVDKNSSRYYRIVHAIEYLEYFDDVFVTQKQEVLVIKHFFGLLRNAIIERQAIIQPPSSELLPEKALSQDVINYLPYFLDGKAICRVRQVCSSMNQLFKEPSDAARLIGLIDNYEPRIKYKKTGELEYEFDHARIEKMVTDNPPLMLVYVSYLTRD
jgi:hypothetical protein